MVLRNEDFNCERVLGGDVDIVGRQNGIGKLRVKFCGQFRFSFLLKLLWGNLFGSQKQDIDRFILGFIVLSRILLLFLDYSFWCRGIKIFFVLFFKKSFRFDLVIQFVIFYGLNKKVIFLQSKQIQLVQNFSSCFFYDNVFMD